jgi:hypothetical protein
MPKMFLCLVRIVLLCAFYLVNAKNFSSNLKKFSQKKGHRSARSDCNEQPYKSMPCAIPDSFLIAKISAS